MSLRRLQYSYGGTVLSEIGFKAAPSCYFVSPDGLVVEWWLVTVSYPKFNSNGLETERDFYYSALYSMSVKALSHYAAYFWYCEYFSKCFGIGYCSLVHACLANGRQYSIPIKWGANLSERGRLLLIWEIPLTTFKWEAEENQKRRKGRRRRRRRENHPSKRLRLVCLSSYFFLSLSSLALYSEGVKPEQML